MRYLIFLTSFYLLSQCVFANTPTRWQALRPGLSYTTVYQTPAFPFGAIHAFKINLKKFKLKLALTHNDKNSFTSVRNLVEINQAILGINGGFFSPNLKPLGLRIFNGKKVSPLKHTSWWGVFYLKNNTPRIVSERQFKNSYNITFAIQSGPRLIINGRIPSLKPGWSFRSALGITRSGDLIIAITDQLPITTKKLAKILLAPEKRGGLNCYNALNLDGGSSSQLYADISGFNLNIPSLAPVSDAILLLER